jgi:hypothetical protein
LPAKVKYNPVSPFAFTEQGVAMLSSILKSEKAIQVNIAILRAFVFLRQYALNHHDLTEKLMNQKRDTIRNFRISMRQLTTY